MPSPINRNTYLGAFCAGDVWLLSVWTEGSAAGVAVGAGVAAPAEQAARVPARDVAARERAKVRCNFILSSSSFVFQGHRYDTG